MDKLDNKLNKFFSRLQFLSPWLIRFGLGIAFSIHGLSKFPLPPKVLIEYFGFSPWQKSIQQIWYTQFSDARYIQADYTCFDLNMGNSLNIPLCQDTSNCEVSKVSMYQSLYSLLCWNK